MTKYESVNYGRGHKDQVNNEGQHSMTLEYSDQSFKTQILDRVKEIAELRKNIVKDTTNPKDSIGSNKDRIGLVPPEGIRQIAKAMRYGAFDAPRADGKFGYSPYNWRDTEIRYTVYLDAVLRHALALVEKNDLDETSKLNHWAHIGANAVLMLDALKQGKVIDDRLQEQKK